jgi:hypothetical protein
MGWLDDMPMPCCPECKAEVDTYTTDRRLEARSAINGAMFFGPPEMRLNPCGCEVAGYVVTVKWTRIGEAA